MKSFKNKKQFLKFVRYCSKEYRNHRASGYLYNFLLKMRLNRRLSQVISNKEFLQLCYVTLDAWDMNSRGSKLLSFQKFQNEISRYKKQLVQLDSYKLHKLDKEKLKQIIEKIKFLYKNIKIAISTKTGNPTKSKLVGNSKLLHFFLPDLCMPMDRKYTMDFFEYRGVSWRKYEKVFKYFYSTIRKFRLQVRDLKIIKFNYPLTFTKMVDNAIIGRSKYHGG